VAVLKMSNSQAEPQLTCHENQRFIWGASSCYMQSDN